MPGSGFKLIVHQVVDLRGAEVDKVCSQWNIFEKRQPVTMDLLCVYPEVTSTLSRCVYYCWSLLESIWVLGFGPFWSVPRTILLSPCGLAILLATLHLFILILSLGTAPWPIKRYCKKKKRKKRKERIWGHVSDNLWFWWLNFFSVGSMERTGTNEAVQLVTHILTFFLPDLTCWLTASYD